MVGSYWMMRMEERRPQGLSWLLMTAGMASVLRLQLLWGDWGFVGEASCISFQVVFLLAVLLDY